MLGLDVIKRETACPIVFDVTHSLQMRDVGAEASGGRRESLVTLANCAVACGIGALFVEAHTDPDNALCDGASALPAGDIPLFLKNLFDLDTLIKSQFRPQII